VALDPGGGVDLYGDSRAKSQWSRIENGGWKIVIFDLLFLVDELSRNLITFKEE
jgi:hypothetical protein